MKQSRALVPLIGLALLGAHGFALPALLDNSARKELAVRLVSAPPVVLDEVIDVRGIVEPSIAARTTVLLDGVPFGARGPVAARTGLRRVTWSLAWGGTFSRSVGVTRVVGPLQSPKGTCGVALHVGQVLLDDGKAGAHTLAGRLARMIRTRGAKMHVPYVGDLRAVRRVRLWWSERARLEGRIAIVGVHSMRLLDARSYSVGPSLRGSVILEFDRATFYLEIAAIPRLVRGELRLEAVVSARAEGRRAIDRAVVGLFRGSRAAVRRASAASVQALAALEAAMRVPPPIDLGGGKVIRLAYCADRTIEIHDRSSATIPLRVLLEPPPVGALARAPVDLPPAVPPPAPTSPLPPLSIDLDLDAVNAVLYDLWATGFLDRVLSARLPAWFDSSEIAKRLLSVRVDAFKFALPPTLEPGGPGGAPLSLGVEAVLVLEDGTLRTPARLFGRVGIAATGRPTTSAGSDTRTPALELSLGGLALTCVDGTILRPCYADLVAEAEREAARLHTSLGDTITDRLDGLARPPTFGTDPFKFDVAGLAMRTFADSRSGWIRLDVAMRARE